jgi:hypothetical protein
LLCPAKPSGGPSFAPKIGSISSGTRSQGGKFQDLDKVLQFVNRYVSTRPDEAWGRGMTFADELSGRIRSEIGLDAGCAEPAVKAISQHVRDLINGHALASEDSARWSVHHAASSLTMYSGRLVYEARDIFIDGAGMDFQFRRTHKSRGFHNGPLGVNWDHNYNLRLRAKDDVHIIRLTGELQEIVYTRHDQYDTSMCHYFVPPPGEHSIIADMADHSRLKEFGVRLPAKCAACRYMLRYGDGTTLYFEDDSGFPGRYRIRQIRDRNGNYLTFSYVPIAGIDNELL